MPIVIGGKPESDFTDPIGMLGDCHRRIERFLQVLQNLAESRQGGPLEESERTALSTSLRYFREAAPKHTADEEESLFPRMRDAGGADTAAIFAKIAALEGDHETATRAHEEVEVLGQSWLSRGSLAKQEASRLGELLRQLSELYQRHIRIEDTEVFPAAAALLSAAKRRAVGAEMAARRGIRPAL